MARMKMPAEQFLSIDCASETEWFPSSALRKLAACDSTLTAMGRTIATAFSRLRFGAGLLCVLIVASGPAFRAPTAAAEGGEGELVLFAEPYDARLCLSRPGLSVCEFVCHGSCVRRWAAGTYLLSAGDKYAEGFQDAEGTFELAPGAHREFTVRIEPSPLEMWLAWSAVVAGFGAGVGIGVQGWVRSGGDPNLVKTGVGGTALMITGMLVGFVGLVVIVSHPTRVTAQELSW